MLMILISEHYLSLSLFCKFHFIKYMAMCKFIPLVSHHYRLMGAKKQRKGWSLLQFKKQECHMQ